MERSHFGRCVMIRLLSSDPRDMIAEKAAYLGRPALNPSIRGYTGQDGIENHKVSMGGKNVHLYQFRKDLRQLIEGEDPNRWFLTDIRLDTTRGGMPGSKSSGDIKYRLTLVFDPPGSHRPAYEDKDGWLPRIRDRFYPTTAAAVPEGEGVDIVVFSTAYGIINRAKDGGWKNADLSLVKRTKPVMKDETIYAARFNPFGKSPEDILYLTVGMGADGERITAEETRRVVMLKRAVPDADEKARAAANIVIDRQIWDPRPDKVRLVAEAKAVAMSAATQSLKESGVPEGEIEKKVTEIVGRVDWDNQINGRYLELDRRARDAARETGLNIFIANLLRGEDPEASMDYAGGKSVKSATEQFMKAGYTPKDATREAKRVVGTIDGPALLAEAYVCYEERLAREANRAAREKQLADAGFKSEPDASDAGVTAPEAAPAAPAESAQS